MESLIHLVKTGIQTKWENGKYARFDYDAMEVWYQLVELTPDGQSFIIVPTERNRKNCPVVALGFVAYLIRNWGRNETEIQTEFYELCFSGFKKVEGTKPGSSKRNLLAEFCSYHTSEEKNRVDYSRAIYPFLTESDSVLINQYVDSYFDFIETYNKIQPAQVINSVTNSISEEKQHELVQNPEPSEENFKQKDKIEPYLEKLPEKLELLFESISKYKTVMEILVSKELIHSNTYIWKDEKKGNKAYLAALLKDLHGKLYYKENKRPTSDQIKAICLHTFGWNVGIDTIKKTKPRDFDFTFIPIASTLE